MVKRTFLSLIIGASTLLLSSCAGEFSADDALETIQKQNEFNVAFCAPLHIGREVLTGDNYKDPKAFVEARYGELVKAGLLTAQIGEKNSWRTIVDVVLTDEGKKMMNVERTAEYQKAVNEDDIFYVAVCKLTPQSVIKVDTLPGDTMQLTYTIVEHSLTPFGKFLGFEEGKRHTHSRKFTKGTWGWELVAIE